MEIRNVHVYGLGAIGSNLLLQLAKQKPELQFSGYDYDKVEPRNIGPQAYFLEHVGMPKTAALGVVLKRHLRTPKYTPVNGKVVSRLTTVPADTLVLDCFDNTSSRKLLTYASGNIFHVGFSPFYTAEGIWSPDYDAPDDVPSDAPDLCTLPDAVAFINWVVNTAALNIVDFLLTGAKKDLIVTPCKESRVPNVRYL